jgi:glycine hydroxymethyltransferase
LQELGIDISKQRSCSLTGDVVERADYIFGMTHGHIGAVTAMYPSAAEKTFLLREFDDDLEPFEKDISDPIGGSYEVYRECRDQIERGIMTMLKFIEQSDSGEPAGRVGRKSVKVALGADHAGTDLKEFVICSPRASRFQISERTQRNPPIIPITRCRFRKVWRDRKTILGF